MGDSGQDTAGRPRRIFLSYGHDEYSGLAARVKADLEKAGHEVWFDAANLKPGHDWETFIEDGLRWLEEKREDARFVLLMTPHSVRRPDGFCLNELAAALAKKLPVVPVMVASCEPPLSICRIQWVDLTGCWPIEGREQRYSAKLTSLVDAVGRDFSAAGAGGAGQVQMRLLQVLKPLPFEADIAMHTKRFTGRRWVLDCIHGWMTDPAASRILLIAGPPGIGKTTLAAWLCNNLEGVAAFHFCRSGNAQKTDARKCVLSLAYQLSTQLPDYRDRLSVSADDGELAACDARTLFDHLVIQPLSDGYPDPGHQVLIVIDAMDEATQGDHNEFADFLADEFMKAPDWLRVIVTTRPDPQVMHPLQGLVPYIINPSAKENLDDIREYLRQELKPLAGGRPMNAAIDAIVEQSEGIFLYAEWIVKELHDGQLSLDRPGEFPRGLGGIYARFIRRQFPDIAYYRQSVRPLLETLVAAQEPLRAPFLASLFGWTDYEREELFRSLGSLFIVEESGIKPFHHTLMEWLVDGTRAGAYFVSAKNGHAILGQKCWAKYLGGAGKWTPYTITSLPTHLCEAGRWEELGKLMRDLDYIRKQEQQDRFNFMKQWTYVEARSPLRMPDAYRQAIETPGSEGMEDLATIAGILYDTSHLGEARKVYEYLIGQYRAAGDKTRLQAALQMEVKILNIHCEVDLAMAYLKEWEVLCRESGDANSVADLLGEQADIAYYFYCDYDKAVDLCREQEKLYRQTGNRRGLASSITWQAALHRARSDYATAMRLLQDAEKLYRDLGDKYNLGLNLGYQGQILMLLGDLTTALNLQKERARIICATGNVTDIAFSETTRATILFMQGDLDGAYTIFKEEEQILRSISNRVAIQEALSGQGIVLRAKGDLEGAMAMFKEQEDICRKNDNKRGLATALGDQAIVLRMSNDLDGAMALHREEEEIYRGQRTRFGEAKSADGQAVVLRMKGDTGGALVLHDNAIRLQREIGYKFGLQEALGDKAMTLAVLGDKEGALALLKEQESLCREMGAKLALDECLKRQRDIAAAAAEAAARETPGS